MMKKFLAFLHIFIFFLASCSISETSDSDKSQTINSPLPKETRHEVDESWDVYTNTEMGFSIKVPKEVIDGSNEKGKPLVPIVISYNSSAETVIISSPYIYKGKTVTAGSWKIHRHLVSDFSELEKFIQQTLGRDCHINPSEFRKNTRLVRFNVSFPDNGLGGTDCKPRQSAWVFFWDSQKNVLFYWDNHQEPQFRDANAEILDGKMQLSFQLLN